MDLRVSTTINLKLGPCVDKADGVTLKTALTPTVKVSKNGGTLAARNSATATAHDADGYYTVELNATDTNTAGRLNVTITDTANILPVWQEFMVLPANVWDGLYSASQALQAATSTTATLDSGANATDGYYVGMWLTIVEGTGAAQTRRVISYVGSTKVATVDVAWVTNPVAGSLFQFAPAASVASTTVERQAYADELLKRNLSLVAGEAARSPINALRFLRNKWTIVATTISVKKEDDVTEAWNASLTTAAGNPVSSVTPT